MGRRSHYQQTEFDDLTSDQFRYVPRAISSDTTITDSTLVLVDSSGGAVTVTLGSELLEAGKVVKVVDNAGSAGTNAITVDTEGSENIEPGTASSKDIAVDWAGMSLVGDDTASDWRAINRNVDQESTTTEQVILSESSKSYDQDLIDVLHWDGSGDITISNLPDHDRYRVEFIEIQQADTGSHNVQIQVNGDANANYDHESFAGATTGDSKWEVGSTSAGAEGGGTVVIDAEGSGITATWMIAGYYSNGVGVGGNTNVSPPLTSITFLNAGANNTNATIAIIGEDAVF